MILTDREIRIAIETRRIILDPRPDEDAFSATSVDLTLDPNISEFVFSASTGQYIDPGKKGFEIKKFLAEQTKRVNLSTFPARYELVPGKLILGWTAEYLDLRPTPRLAARVEGKSSLGRMGLAVHITAPTIHAGFEGTIQLEIINHGPIPIVLQANMKICQLIFEQTLGTPEKLYRGQFAGQKPATSS